MISIIIPTYNEEAQIGGLLRNLFALPGDFEVIVVDGESRDGTSRIVDAMRGEWPNRLRLMEAERNRAIQLNRGAEKARGDTLLFLHADARLPEQSLLNLERELSRDGIVGGNFDLEFDGKGFWDRAFSSVNRWRRRLGFYYGDSGIFVRRRVFDRAGRLPPHADSGRLRVCAETRSEWPDCVPAPSACGFLTTLAGRGRRADALELGHHPGPVSGGRIGRPPGGLVSTRAETGQELNPGTIQQSVIIPLTYLGGVCSMSGCGIGSKLLGFYLIFLRCLAGCGQPSNIGSAMS